MEICRHDECTGCFACQNVCPKQCIEKFMDEYGYIYPKINESECIGCMRCKNVCPVNLDVKTNEPKTCYAAWSTDKNDRASSASGGAASVFSSKIIEKNGVVYGALYDEGFIIDRADSIEGISSFKGSKYVQCYTNGKYVQVKKDLEDGLLVIYTGTPCQIAGLRNFLGKDYNNLYTVDLICHGVPAEFMLQQHIENAKGVSMTEVGNITFRENSQWALSIHKKSKETISVNAQKDLYFKSFLEALTYRESCYDCKYASKERVGDVTLGDFWGLGMEEEFPFSTEGVSVVLINTEKGKDLVDFAGDKLVLVERTVKEAIDGNHQLREPSKKHKDRKLFEKTYLKHGFDRAVEVTSVGKTIKKNIYKQKIIRLIPRFIKNMLR